MDDCDNEMLSSSVEDDSSLQKYIMFGSPPCSNNHYITLNSVGIIYIIAYLRFMIFLRFFPHSFVLIDFLVLTPIFFVNIYVYVPFVSNINRYC